MTGFGTERDRTGYSVFAYGGDLTDEALTGLYEGNDIARTIVSIVPEEIFRKGVEITHTSQLELERQAAKLELLNRLQEAMIWGRLFGGGICVLGLDDGRPADTELDPRRIARFAYIDVYDKSQARIVGWYADKADSRYGKPSVFEFTDLNGGRLFRVHETRCVVFGGAHTTKRTRQRRQGWDLSVLQAPHDVLRAFGNAFQSLEHMLLDASVGVLAMKGLISKIASLGGREELATRATVFDLWRNASRTIMLDADGESYKRESASFTGVGDVIQAFIVRLAAAAKIPVTVLMGQAPAGLNATGASDIRLFYDRIGTEQTQVTPTLERVYGYIAIARGFDPTVKVGWPKLWEETPAEKATREKTESEADGNNITNQVLLPEEVTKMRFAGRPEVDMTLREPFPKRGNPGTPVGAPTPKPADPFAGANGAP